MAIRPTRRRFLRRGCLVPAVGLAGCSSDGGGDRAGTTRTATAAESPTAPRATADESEGRTTYVVAPDGADGAEGSAGDPLASIQAALDRAGPGDTVRVGPGEYREHVDTVRAGAPGAPITVTGPPDAVLRPPARDVGYGLFDVTHSHVHLRGLSIDGLADPERADDPAAYVAQPVNARPPTGRSDGPDYLTDVKVMPHRIGNAAKRLVNAFRVNHLEVGEFEVIGPAGVGYYGGDDSRYVIGSVLSVGRSANNFGTESYPWPGPDESHDIHVHHVANLEGYRHTELVKTHAGNYDVTVEYCTDAGGFGRPDSPGAGSSVLLLTGRSTVRWCDIAGGEGIGVFVYVPAMKQDGSYGAFAPIPDERFPGRHNAIYGNRIATNSGPAVAFSSPDWVEAGPGAQRLVCGNEYSGETMGEPDRACPGSVPDGDGVGHAGGDGPWS